MRFLRQNTATRITAGPFLDRTDGITPEVALTVTNCALTLMVDNAGVPTLVLDAAATASGGDNDMVHVTNDNAGFYDLELTAAQTNYVGRAMLAITDAANHCPVFHEFMLVPANVYDSLFGTDALQVDAIQVGGTTLTARDIGLSVLLSAGTGTGQISLSSGAVTVGTSNDKTGYALSTAGVQAIWDALTSALTTAGSIGKRIIDYLTGDVFARLGAPAGASVSADIAAVKSDSAAIKLKTDNLPASPAASGDVPTAAAVADAVWDEAISGHLGAGSTGAALNAAGSAGDPWSTPIPGAYGAGTAGKIVGDSLNATVGSRASQTSVDTVDDFLDTEVASILAAVDTEVATIISTLGTPAGVSLAADVAAVKVDTAATLADTGTDGVVVAAGSKTGYALTADYDAAKTAAQAGNAMALTSAERNSTADALLDRAAGVETNRTPRQAMRLMLAALAGKLSGGGTTSIAIRDTNDTKDRIAATVDENGNRSAVTLDAT